MVEELNDMLYSWFRYVECHEDWTDEQILFSLNEDDVKKFKEYLTENFEEFFEELLNLYKEN